ncbi:hypothetical protein DSO57_1008458 [Entomophthora muscae]|uniref:Uncharacterized protein n=1 Tax=Entomophthora muscae TaxID=34485 RepID=A0ACC2U524_9FUNG|nr:hypothetical protein DSO57_1008458 [Entomophthora muscae]
MSPPFAKWGGMTVHQNTFNPFEFTALRYKGTVIKHVLPKIIFFVIYTAILVAAHELIDEINLFIPNSLVLILNSSISLLLVFRTNTAYDRYWEGRKIWSTMTTAIRNLVRLLLVNIPGDTDELKLQKMSVIDLLIAYPIATKHYLRQEYGPDYDDLREKLRYIPEYSTPSALNSTGTRARPSMDLDRGTNLPLDIKMYISSFIKHQQNKGRLNIPLGTQLLANLNILISCLNGFERILQTPIPLAYSIHLSQIVWAYCLFLPFQILGSYSTNSPGYHWISIPVMAVIVFTFFGVINIGEEIENPFGYDYNDLPLDDFCQVIEEEIRSLTSFSPPSIKSWELSNDQVKPSHTGAT